MSLLHLLNCFDNVKFNSDADALKILSKNFKCDRGIITRKDVEYNITDAEYDAISYLISEWDYDFHTSMYSPSYRQLELPTTISVSANEETEDIHTDDFFVTLFIGFVAGVSFAFIVAAIAVIVAHFVYGV